MPNYRYKILNILFFIVLFKIFDSTPLYLLDKFLSILAIFIALFYVSRKFLLSKNYFYTTSRKFMGAYLLLFTLSLFMSSALYGQSYIDSISANLATLSLFILTFYAFRFKKNKVSIPYMEKLIIIFTVVNIFVLLAFSGYQVRTTTQFSEHELSFKANFLPKNFIRLSVFYFFCLYLKKKKQIYGIISLFLLLFPNVLIDFQRGYFTTVMALMCLTIFFVRKSNKLVTNIITGLAFISFAFIILLGTSSSALETITTKYASAISGVISGKSKEASVNARFSEAKIGMKLFSRSPVIGVGRLRSANVSRIFGADYYASDVGFIGILSTYGIIGLSMYICLLVIIFRKTIYTLRRSSRYSVFTISLITYILSLFIESLETGSVMLEPAYWVFLYLLYAYSKKLDDEAAIDEELPEEEQEADTEHALPTSDYLKQLPTKN